MAYTLVFHIYQDMSIILIISSWHRFIFLHCMFLCWFCCSWISAIVSISKTKRGWSSSSSITYKNKRRLLSHRRILFAPSDNNSAPRNTKQLSMRRNISSCSTDRVISLWCRHRFLANCMLSHRPSISRLWICKKWWRQHEWDLAWSAYCIRQIRIRLKAVYDSVFQQRFARSYWHGQSPVRLVENIFQ